MDTLAALNAAVRANVPVMLIGPPGIGKTARIRKITEQLGWPIYEVIASIREPSDFGGYPVPVNSHVRLVPSGEWQDFAAKVEEAGAGVLFLDEISCFTAGTPVAVFIHGEVVLVPIEQVRPGMAVVGLDLNSGRSCASVVTHVLQKKESHGVHVTFTDGRSLTCTAKHEFYTAAGWLPAGDLRGGCRVCNLSDLWAGVTLDNRNTPAQTRNDDCRVSLDIPTSTNGDCGTNEAPNGEGAEHNAPATFGGPGVQCHMAERRKETGVNESVSQRGGECGDSEARCGHVRYALNSGGTRCHQSERRDNRNTATSRSVEKSAGCFSGEEQNARRACDHIKASYRAMGGPKTQEAHLRHEQTGCAGRADTIPDARHSPHRSGEASDCVGFGVESPASVHGGQQTPCADPERYAALAQSRFRLSGNEEGGSSGSSAQLRDPAEGNGRVQGRRILGASRDLEGDGSSGVTGAQDSEVSWAVVQSVERVELNELVYDLTTTTHNYTVANGLVVHNCAAPAIQAALMRVVLDKCVGELHLPSATRIVCASNPTSLAAGGWDLAAPLANRLLHLQWPEPSVDDWAQWLLVESVHESVERRWRGAEGQRVRALLAGFMHVRGSLLLDVPKDEESRGRAWPSPRSWAMCARALSEVVDAHPAELPLDMLGLVAASAVGAGAGGELVAWARDADLPDPEVILEDPKKWHVDLTRQDRVWAVLGSVYGAVMGALDTKGKMPEKRWRAAWRVFAHADKSGATAAATAALAIPLAHAAVPGGPAADLGQPEEVRAANAMRMAALGLEAQG